jgi:hypothetical protein
MPPTAFEIASRGASILSSIGLMPTISHTGYERRLHGLVRLTFPLLHISSHLLNGVRFSTNHPIAVGP